MSVPAASYRRVFYDLRPAKQIERRMIIDTLQLLAEGGFHIRDYQYTGLGSIYFVDFQLFHRFLGIRRLMSVEFDTRIARRVDFNKPFADVQIAMAAIGDIIPLLNRDILHFVWLDYDTRLNASIIQDIVLAGQVLSPGSILLITVDVDPRDTGDPSTWQEYYEREAADYVPFDADVTSFAKSQLGATLAAIIANAIKQGVAGRDDMSYYQLFSFEYSDGSQMLTVGGVIGGAAERKRLDESGLDTMPYLRSRLEDPPFQIRVPRLTRRERILLDRNMPCSDGWAPSEFELSTEDVADYRLIYRYYPIYGELLI